MKKYLPIISLMFFNLIPIFGVIYWGWNLFDILFLYWLESLVIVFFNALKMHKITMTNKQAVAPSYFVYGFIYFMLAAFWLFFLFLFFGPLKETFTELPGESLSPDIILAALGLLISHGISYKENFIAKNEYKLLNVDTLFFAPIYRYSIIQFVVFFTGIFILISNSAIYTVILMVIIKIIFDIFIHWQEHKLKFNIKYNKIVRIIGYIFVLGPVLIIPMVWIVDPLYQKFQKGTLNYQIIDSIITIMAFGFMIGVLILMPIGAILLSKTKKDT